MATKSIIDIEIDDSKFLKFKSIFDDYKRSLEETPEAWSDANSQMGNMVQASQLLKNDAEKRLALLQAATLEETKAEKAQQKQDEARRKSTETRKKTDLEAVKRWKDLGSTIASTTVQLAKFASIGLGLATGATTFGMGGLASAASSTRFQSMGLGVSSGAMQSANLNYGGKLLGSPTQSLTALRESQTDITQAWKFSTLGVQNAANKSTEQLLPEVLTKMRDILKAVPASQRENRAKVLGMDSIINAEDRQRMVTVSDSEFEAANKQYQQDLKELNIKDSTLKSFQDLNTQWDRTKDQFFKTFVEGLEPLAPALTRFSEAVGDAFQKFMAADKLEPMINKLADGITKFADYLDKNADKDFEKLKKWVSETADGLEKLAEKITSVLAFFGLNNDESKGGGESTGMGGAALAAGVGLGGLALASLAGGLALPLAALTGTGVAAYKFGGDTYQNDSAENQEWTQKIVGGIAALFGDEDAIAAQKQIANYTRSADKTLEKLKPMTAEEYKKIESDNQNSFVSKLGESFKISLNDLWQKTKIIEGEGEVEIGDVTPYTGKLGDFDTKSAEYMPRVMRDLGLDANQAAAAFGNLGQESEGLQPGIQERDPKEGKGGKGWGQWTGPRRVAFDKYLKDTGQSEFSDEANYQFFLKEGRGTHKHAIEILKTAKDLKDGVYKFERAYEGSADVDDYGNIVKPENYKSRYDYASRALAAGQGGKVISISDYKGKPFKTGEKIKDSYALRTPPTGRPTSIMFGDQNGSFCPPGRVMININNSTGGSATSSALCI
jgi:hypothetical protein